MTCREISHIRRLAMTERMKLTHAVIKAVNDIPQCIKHEETD